MDAWTVYWLFKLDDISTTICILTGLLGCALIFWTIFSVGVSFEKESYYDNTRKVLKKFTFLPFTFFIFLITATLIPSTKTMAAIIVLPKIASADNLKTVSEDAGDIYKLAMSRLKEALGENPAPQKS